MKSVFIIFLIFFSSILCFAQETKVISRSTKSGDLEGKVFNKITGELITNMQLMELLKVKPGLQMENFYDKYGDLEKCLYDPTAPFKRYSRDQELRPKLGEEFPEFVFSSIEGEEFSSNQLNGKWVLIHFTPFSEFINKDLWGKLVLDLRLARKNDGVECFGLFAYDDDLNEPVGEFQPDVKLVNNGSGFFARYHIIETPTTVLINPEGIVIQYFYGNDPIDFLKFLKK